MDSDADCFACETIPCVEEALALTELARHYPKPYWISFSCRSASALSDGSDIESAVQQVLASEFPPIAIGVNCSAPRYIAPLIKRIHKQLQASRASKVKLLVYPNSGEQYDATEKCWHGQADIERFVDAAVGWVAAGADWVGGCCRTTPSHIRSLAAELEK